MTKPTFTVKSPTDLIALAPLVLGFHPEDSVVLLSFGGRDPFHARINMPLNSEEREGVVGALIEPIRRHRIREAAVLIFSDDEQAARGVANSLSDALEEAGTRLIEVIRTDGERYSFPMHPYVDPVPYDISDHAFAAEAVLLGRQTLPSRAALADRLVGCDEAERDAVRAAAIANGGERSDPESDVSWLRDVISRASREDRLLDSEDAGRALLLMTDEAMSQIVLEEALHHAVADDAGERLVRLVEFWADLVRRSPEELTAPAAAVLAFLAWQSGDGAFAWCAVETSLAEDPEHTLALAVADCLREAVPPVRSSGNDGGPWTSPGDIREAS